MTFLNRLFGRVFLLDDGKMGLAAFQESVWRFFLAFVGIAVLSCGGVGALVWRILW